MHERKALMASLSDAFVALPGGFGTYEELFEVVTWTQLGVHKKPCGMLNVAGFYDPLVQFLDHAVTERFIRPEHRAAMLVETEPGAPARCARGGRSAGGAEVDWAGGGLKKDI